MVGDLTYHLLSFTEFAGSSRTESHQSGEAGERNQNAGEQEAADGEG